MQLPTAKSSYQTRTRFGRYLTRRLRRAKRLLHAEDVAAATQLLREAGRAWEDTEDAMQDALADRDGADDDLDTGAQEARNTLAGRGVEAVKQAPYTAIFPQGIGYYTAAPLDEEVKRYGELRQRIVEHLPASDPVRMATVNVIEAGIKDFKSATEALDAARTADAMAATRLTTVTDAWTRLIEKTYGALVAEVGRAAAEHFFPRVKKTKKSASEPAPK